MSVLDLIKLLVSDIGVHFSKNYQISLETLRTCLLFKMELNSKRARNYHFQLKNRGSSDLKLSRLSFNQRIVGLNPKYTTTRFPHKTPELVSPGCELENKLVVQPS